MKAVMLTARDEAGVTISDVSMPLVRKGHCLVKMRAASVNRVDLYMRDDGTGIPHSLPQIMGVDGVGDIAAIGTDSKFSKGDRVILYPHEFCGTCRYCLAGDQPLCKNARLLREHRDGAFCEYALVPETSLGRLSPTTIIDAAQLAAKAGYHVIVTTTGDAKKSAPKAEGWTVIDYAGANYSRNVRALTQGVGVDRVVDNVGEKTWEQSMRSLRRGGHLVTCGATTGAHPSADIQRMLIRQLNIHCSTMGSIVEFHQLIACFEAGRLTPRIDSIYPLTETHAALDRLSQADRIGKVLIQISDWDAVSKDITL